MISVLLLPCFLSVAAAGFAEAEIPLPRVTNLHIERHSVDEAPADNLFTELLEAAVPGHRDNFHHNLIGIKGDAGVPINGLSSAERVAKFRELAAAELTN